ncbi:related to MAK11 protein (maintenance of killer toxin-encoding satellite M1 dsRNA) [Sporisorium reilianum SRZ2]|uniref:Related to MAK11 protein (Maintenance of killer toxin-encoding satellite M1 dsRNA) n=1 Tax=Sporisorium reilianum (strain SRZ2) TaxID=999809 RepID=E6ZN87_SPORE|nr:related to MAK11 protein (maintenance of killer toxin-encoding satellite M1 dsRNA) [Sporisorium reilianum SRZ2]
MPAQKRGRSNDAGAGSSQRNTGGPSATVYRKSAKKQRSDQQQEAAAASKPAKKPVPQHTRPKDDPKPKTKHEFIQAKKAAALKEKEEAAAARRAEEAAEKQLRKKQVQQQKGEGVSSKGAPQPPPTILIKPPQPTSSFKIVAGSYERLLYGLEATVEPASSSTSTSTAFAVSLKPIFTFPAHISSIRTVATAGADSKWLATGGTDEIVKVWDLRKQREVGQLTGHEGTITSLVFASRTYLLTTSADAHMNLYRTRDWALLRTLKGHIGRINSAAPHPTGRLALSVGSDRTIRMWDLMRGQAAASTRIGIEADLVRWDTEGSRFVVLAYRQAMVFRTDMTKVAELEEKKRIGDVCFFRVTDAEGRERELFFAGLEDGIVKVFDLDASVADEATASNDDSDSDSDEDDLAPLVEVGRLVGHQNRVRSVAVLPVSVPSRKGKSTQTSYVATTISSDGLIRTFDLGAIVGSLSSTQRTLAQYAAHVVSVESNAQFDTKGTRLTCLTAVGVAGSVSGGAEQDEAEDADVIGSDEEEEESEVDVEAEDAELKALERALKDAQAKGLDLEDLEGLLDSDDDDEEDDDDEVVEDEDEDEDEDEGELE